MTLEQCEVYHNYTWTYERDEGPRFWAARGALFGLIVLCTPRCKISIDTLLIRVKSGGSGGHQAVALTLNAAAPILNH
eukprot:SAG22_NODE_153_length_17315_cov_69.981935_6_plen_78_part_00